MSSFKLPLITRKPLNLSGLPPNPFSVGLPSQDIGSDYSLLSGLSCPKFEGVFFLNGIPSFHAMADCGNISIKSRGSPRELNGISIYFYIT